jgi:hypothetical protein
LFALFYFLFVRCCSIVLPLEIGPSGAVREPREVPHTFEGTSHGGPQRPTRPGPAGAGASMCCVSKCKRQPPRPPEDLRKLDLDIKRY